MFVSDINCVEHRLDTIVKVEWQDQKGVVATYIGDGGVLHNTHIAADDWLLACEAAYPVVPAQPGYFAIHDGHDELDWWEPSLTAVVAWRVTPSCTIPIGIDWSPPHEAAIWPVLRPDGRVEAHDAGVFPSLTDYQRHRNARRRNREVAALQVRGTTADQDAIRSPK